ncbi:cell division protein FtsL [Ruegeria sediminis]|uniref:Cell division protein FtsL n=1 Tax=Ruegeria sediminis TaxID=2583820 RepID=A0ABY2WYJ3_9RHOB|nr:cell division protein FtsL [Ruegeria sediminis]TMV07909.1 cell division protein FtsL [Ruegeria sediminis]
MKSVLYVLTALSVFGLALWAYQENYRTQQVLKETQLLQHQIGAAQARLSILRAEWAYLNRPDRLRELADLNFERLGLLPLRAEQFGRADQIAYGEDPDLPIVDPGELQAITDVKAMAEVQQP